VDLNNPAHPGHCNQLISTEGRKVARVWYHPNPLLEVVKNELIDICQGHRFERCGFICAEHDVWEVPNSHSNPKSNYFISNDDAAAALHEIYEIQLSHIIALWHTHPNNVPWPSPRDICGWPNPLLEWRYLIVTNDDVLEWSLVNDPAFTS
jgi:proteasome lid subunit RPN8/RPN11